MRPVCLLLEVVKASGQLESLQEETEHLSLHQLVFFKILLNLAFILVVCPTKCNFGALD